MRSFRVALVCAAALVVATALTGSAGAARGDDQLQKINHIVVIYEENHSFDNLYGGWEGVNGLASADAAHTTQVDQNGNPYSCLRLDDANLALVSVGSCTAPSGFPNSPFTIDDFIKPTDNTCPNDLSAFASQTGFLKDSANTTTGGCTRDIVHRFYEEQYQLNGGHQNRYATGSDAEGLVMGHYDTRALPIYRYLHSPGHPAYAIADDFFQAAFGGSFLNHQWLIAARTPDYTNEPANQVSVLDSNLMTLTANHQDRWLLYTSPNPGTIVDGAGAVACPAPAANIACGPYAVNTTEPMWEPTQTFSPPLAPQTNPTIGDRLDAAGIDWAWYSGGWSNANGDVNGPGWTNGQTSCTDPGKASYAHFPFCPNNVFQQHHQPFNYFQTFAPAAQTPQNPNGETPYRAAHLQDEAAFTNLLAGSGKDCGLKPVSFVKPVGQENEHPGYASEPNGSDHLVSLLQAIEGSSCAKDTMVVVTYDEFGGQWDHVPPPGQGEAPCAWHPWSPGVTPCSHDVWGPGTRVPALVVSPFLRGNFVVDHTQYDTTSILATIEHRYGLDPLSTRDAAVNDLSSVFAAKQYEAATP